MPLTNKKVSSNMLRMGREDYVKFYLGGAYGDAQDIEGYKVEFVPQYKSVNMLIWNPKEPCVHLVLHEGDTTASLNWVGYDAKCTTDGKMERGTGTKKMLDFAFRLAKERGATHIELMDDSKVMCGSEKVDLGPMYFLQHGMTWYEKNFGFQPREEFREEYSVMKNRRLETFDIQMLKQKPCVFFTRQNVKSLLREIKGDMDVFSIASWVKEL